jgi:hypothetical protein
MLIFAADHAYCEAYAFDIDVMAAIIAVLGEDRCGVRDAAEAPADTAAASQPGDEPHLPAVDTGSKDRLLQDLHSGPWIVRAATGRRRRHPLHCSSGVR